MNNHDVIIYCDGSYLNRHRCGGWAAIIPGMPEPIGAPIPSRMPFPVNSYTIELYAIIQSLDCLTKYEQSVVVYTDCQSLIESKKPALPCYQDLWKELHTLVAQRKLTLELKWVKGHHKNMWNKLVDRTARFIAKEQLRPVSYRRKTVP